MLTDHLGRAILPEHAWLTYIGRLAFLLFAFQLVESHTHTKNKKRYALRLFIFALISEIPFDLMAYGMPVFWDHQNIMWTLLLGLLCIYLADSIATHLAPPVLQSFSRFALVFFFFSAATILRTDYLGFGILQIYLFYRFYERRHSPFLFIGTVLVNSFCSGEPYIHLLGTFFPSQALATLALLPISIAAKEAIPVKHGPFSVTHFIQYTCSSYRCFNFKYWHYSPIHFFETSNN